MSDIVIYAGDVTLEKSIWDNVWGMYIQLKLEQRPHEKTTANPFKKFTKMKQGRVGTRFGAVFTCSDESIFYQDEVMLKHWGDGTTGWTLHLWVNPDDAGFHPWMSTDNKSMFALAMVELDDDNVAINQTKRERLVTAKKHKQTLSNFAAQLCRTPEFWGYLTTERELDPKSYPGCADSPAMAAAWMRQFLGIGSRSELDTDAVIAEQFHTGIRKPYAAWNSQRQ